VFGLPLKSAFIVVFSNNSHNKTFDFMSEQSCWDQTADEMQRELDNRNEDC